MSARLKAFEDAMREHAPVIVDRGYCGGCEVCGTREEHAECRACGFVERTYRDGPACPIFLAAETAYERVGGNLTTFYAEVFS